MTPVFATVADLAAWLRDHNVEIRIKAGSAHWVVKIETGDPTTDVSMQGSSLVEALMLAAIGYEAAVIAKQMVPNGTDMIPDEITARVRGRKK